MWPKYIKRHRDAEVSAQVLEETIRESRANWDTAKAMLYKVKRATEDLWRNLCMHCWNIPSDECEICNWNYTTE